MSHQTAIQSAETLAALRAAATAESRLAVKCEDPLARHFLGPKFKLLTGLRPRSLFRCMVDASAPGSYCFAIARTRHFDEVLRAELAAGATQVVLLGAGYDSRPFRFRRELDGVRVFEIDHPGTQARKRAMLEAAGVTTPANVTYMPVDFTVTRFQDALAAHGFDPARKTVFLWEGVSYYLPQAVVEDVLDFVAACAPGSSIVFDYALRQFVDGDASTYGSRQVADWLKRIGEPFLFGLQPHETPGFLAARGLAAVSDLGPEDVEAAYLKTNRGASLGKTLGHVRMVHARRPATH